MRTLVTGGGGFIGSHVVDRLVAAGHDVAVVDLRPPHRPDVGHIPADINDLEGLVAALAGADVVFHLAAYADVNDVSRDPVDATDANVVGVAKVWEACRRNGVGRAVLASTVWVYNGAASDGDGPLDEDAAFRLDDLGHLYTSSKVAAEMVAHSYRTLYGQEFTILRYGIPYGPRMRDSLVIPKFVGMALRGEPLTIQGDGSQYRNYVYVEDLAEAHVLALRPEAANETFNLEGREKISIRSMVESIGEALGRPVDVTYTPARTGDYGGREISAAKAERVLGWRADVPFADGLRRYVDWHLARDAAPAAAPAPAAVPAPAAAPAPVPAAVAAPAPAGAGAAPAPAGAGAPVRPPLSGVLAGLGLAVLALPALSAAGSDPAGLATAVSGSLAAALVAWAARRRSLRPVPVPVAGGVTLATVWLLSQASPGPVTVILGLLLGFSLGAPLAGQSLVGTPTAAGLAGTAGLAAVAVFDPSALFWLGAALGVGTSLGPLAAGVSRSGRAVPAAARRVARKRVSWALTGLIVLMTAFTASWVGATSARADWFGTVISHGSRAVPEAAVTFDGVPDAETAQTVLAALDAEGVQATFFAAGRDVEARPDVVRTLVEHGQLVANNSYAADGGAFLDPHYGELGRAQEVFDRELGVCPTYFRPPAGRHTPLMARVVHHYGMSMVTWDVKVTDRRVDSPRKLARRALDRIRPGSIVVFPFDGTGRFARPAEAASLPLVLHGLQGLGLESVRLDRMLGSDGYAGRCTPSA
ncbi:MAG TPA: NAD-dependent epimerase/dehydratase family protein [Acidimicrobiia bacterium]|nr:NAD-dependent epimerase/dehydratase family protein [Acidimicrobiia bacterium]